MCDLCGRRPAPELSREDVREYQAEGWDNLLVLIGRRIYDSEAVYKCDGCGEQHADAHELPVDSYGQLCDDCREELKRGAVRGSPYTSATRRFPPAE